MPDPPFTGGCLCGRVRFEVTQPLVSAGYCHCTRCQKRTGTAASAQARVATGALVITEGADVVRSFDPPDGFSKAFCGACGGALWSRGGDIVSVRLGAFDADTGARPAYRQFVASAAAWETLPNDGLPRFPGRRPPEG